MAISSNTLFHFTKTKENLLGILQDTFHPRYCLEKFGIGDMETEAAIPMVSFCDIPLSQIKKHLKIYGKYGLGLSKQWAKKRGLNPVLYLRKKSTFSQHIESILNNLLDDPLRSNDAASEISGVILDVLRYIKPYKGTLYRDNGSIPKIRFYDEREWRYVPNLEKTGFNFFLKKDDFLDPEKRNRENDKLFDARLTFEPSDIKYIILDKETEILPMVSALKQIKAKYDDKIIDILITRILTTDRILNDF